ncbi:MAG: hypothetical protein WBG53_17695 [Rhodococcus sp. (in: high G+C Gram-positive bacteria)]|uniref:hypothetical protein n=1 Tax=unclassified Rhodococcus (in: high G+C Gram-positive bacteria) TaxID=192944 RepID=UPI000EF8C322|nr:MULTISPECIES: hypothetical protein [unclassified Rhodococcus (in: high G+C Gram-positive bacteria)]
MIGASVLAGTASAVLMIGAYVIGDLYARRPGHQRLHTISVALAGSSAAAAVIFAITVDDILVIAGTLAFVTLAMRTLNRSLLEVDSGRPPGSSVKGNDSSAFSSTTEASRRDDL